ncbi:aspartate kinase [Phytoactinopolyspora limicola]|uniref:aspartate kinase n=1 Tax=Phytoactinopolyspora limicola TaxID=2715536 RepID=UPI00140CAD0B|nr:aspartate kinase [Phytoactinopolyspora limicola]
MGDVLVQKYGGSSLLTLDQVLQAAECVARSHHSGKRMAVVVSARGDATDQLIRLAEEICGAGVATVRARREADQLMATGETAAAAQMALALGRLGVPSVSLTGGQCGITVAGRQGAGTITGIDTGRIYRHLDAGEVVVVAGFQGINDEGDVVTLGRGGSDTTAVALAAALRARHCAIFTDVGGVCTADPRLVRAAGVLPVVDTALMAEMAFAGAKVLHTRAAELAALRGVEIHLGSSRAQELGTVITDVGEEESIMMETDTTVMAVTHETDVAGVVVRPGKDRKDPTEKVLTVLAQRSIPVDQVTHCSTGCAGEPRLGFTTSREHAESFARAMSDGAPELSVTIQGDMAKVSLIGVGLLTRPGHMSRLISVLAAKGISVGRTSTSQSRLSVTVPGDRVVDAVEALHREFELTEVGTGQPSSLPV